MSNITLYKTTGYNHYDEIRDLYWRINSVTFKETDPTKATIELWAHLSIDIAMAYGCRVMNTTMELVDVEQVNTQDYATDTTAAIAALDPNAEELSPLLNATTIEIEI